jgi:hypothetical protein
MLMKKDFKHKKTPRYEGLCILIKLDSTNEELAKVVLN